MNKKLLSLTIPNIITNITVPLLGMVDLAIVGRVEGGVYLGAIAIGTTIFNLLYWGFGFLRMGTTGLVAQALGAKNRVECGAIFARAVFVSLVIGALIWVFQIPIFALVKTFMNISPTMLPEVKEYFFVRIWAAPAVMMLYTMKGWLLGMQNARLPMLMAIIINVVNIACSYFFAFQLGMGLSGVALGTVVAQYAGLLIGLIAILAKYRTTIVSIDKKDTFQLVKMKHFFAVNSSIFVRSLGMIFVFTFFTSASSSMGDDILNANTLLLQLFSLFSYLMDGFAYAGESLTGKYYGAKDSGKLRHVIKLVVVWGVGLSVVFTFLYAFFLKEILMIFTENSAIIDSAYAYRYWVVAVPFSGFLAFAYDGIATGMLRTRAMRDTILIATALFFALYFVLVHYIGNNALWIAFLAFLLFRGLSLCYLISVRRSSTFSSNS